VEPLVFENVSRRLAHKVVEEGELGRGNPVFEDGWRWRRFRRRWERAGILRNGVWLQDAAHEQEQHRENEPEDSLSLGE
jgi:hypothetical protein